MDEKWNDWIPTYNNPKPEPGFYWVTVDDSLGVWELEKAIALHTDQWNKDSHTRVLFYMRGKLPDAPSRYGKGTPPCTP